MASAGFRARTHGFLTSWYALVIDGMSALEDEQRSRHQSVSAALLRLIAVAVVLGAVLSVALWILSRQVADAWCTTEAFRRGVLVEGPADRDWRRWEELSEKDRSRVRCELGREPYLRER